MLNYDDMHDIFEKVNDGEYIKFERVENKLHHRPDLHAFLLLDKLVPGEGDMVCGASHDQIYLDTDLKKFAEVATEEIVLELVRCGVSCDGEGLWMFA